MALPRRRLHTGDMSDDPMMPIGYRSYRVSQLTLWPRRPGVISHDSALDLWDLCDVNPNRIHVTVPKSARLRRRVPPTYQVHERDLEPDELANIDGIPVVTPLRAILDGLERHLDRRLVNQAIDNADRRGLLLPGERDLLEAESA